MCVGCALVIADRASAALRMGRKSRDSIRFLSARGDASKYGLLDKSARFARLCSPSPKHCVVVCSARSCWTCCGFVGMLMFGNELRHFSRMACDVSEASWAFSFNGNRGDFCNDKLAGNLRHTSHDKLNVSEARTTCGNPTTFLSQVKAAQPAPPTYPTAGSHPAMRTNYVSTVLVLFLA